MKLTDQQKHYIVDGIAIFLAIAFMMTLILCSCTKEQKPIEVTTLSLHREAGALTYQIKTNLPVHIWVTYELQDTVEKAEFLIIDQRTLRFESKKITYKSFIRVNWYDTRGKNEMWIL